MSPSKQLPVIISGAGIVGLTLAQALKKENISFQIYERDTHLHARSAGWGISIYCAHPALADCMPSGFAEELCSVQVDLQHELTDVGSVFLNLETAKPRFVIPSNFRRRVSREKLRKLLTAGIDVNRDKQISGFNPTKNGILISFSDGTDVEGSLLAAADGSGSNIRQLLLGMDLGGFNQLLVRSLAVTVCLPEEKANRLQTIAPLKFQGCHPDTGYYMWYSILSTPQVNSSFGANNPHYEAQLNVSWLVKGSNDDVPETNFDRLANIKYLARMGTGFEKTLRETIEDIPDGTEVFEITLADWPTIPWHGFDGRVTLLGDAAHPMTMYRGEAANHGLLDAQKLMKQLRAWHLGEKTRSEALADYEAEMIVKGHEAVLLSRKACLDAHEIQNLSYDSPLITRMTVALPRTQDCDRC
ncbi:FAD binding domain-containing protein [Penicillium malachiteum]|uniref:FAD binding domain-containing protein n=1 Tax=Penicillium malachiteum TaxID=1324776 RepID=A0AAD6HKW2_9EURO|nr:FAD binding domain-containing protein [Penicillium malachiteum]